MSHQGNGCSHVAVANWREHSPLVVLSAISLLKPDGNWPEFTDDEVAMYSNRIGNQALLRASDNSDLRSIGFAEKKKIYAQSPYVLTSQIAGLDAWSVASISQRQKALSLLAVKAWPV